MLLFYLILLVSIFGKFCKTLDIYLPKEKQVWNYGTMVNRKLFFNLRISVNETHIPMYDELSTKLESIYSLTIYFNLGKSKLDFISFSNWDEKFPNLRKLFIFQYGNIRNVFIQLFKSNISELVSGSRVHMLFPKGFLFENLRSIQIKSRAFTKSDLQHSLPNIENLVVEFDKNLNELQGFNKLRSLTLLFFFSYSPPKAQVIKNLPELTDLHVFNPPSIKSDEAFLLNLPKLTRINITQMQNYILDDIYADPIIFKCQNLSTEIREINLIHVSLSILKFCPEILNCYHCSKDVSQSVILDIFYSPSQAHQLFQETLPDFKIFNTSELVLINLPVAFNKFSFDKFPQLQILEIRISILSIIHEFSPIFIDNPFIRLLESLSIKRIFLSISSQCGQLIPIVEFFQSENKSSILEVKCLFNETVYNKESIIHASRSDFYRSYNLQSSSFEILHKKTE